MEEELKSEVKYKQESVEKLKQVSFTFYCGLMDKTIYRY